MDISQSHHYEDLKDWDRRFREKYGDRPDLTLSDSLVKKKLEILREMEYASNCRLQASSKNPSWSELMQRKSDEQVLARIKEFKSQIMAQRNSE